MSSKSVPLKDVAQTRHGEIHNKDGMEKVLWESWDALDQEKIDSFLDSRNYHVKMPFDAQEEAPD
ncbi:hypothetical protein, partial, partial [Absidia glauca]